MFIEILSEIVTYAFNHWPEILFVYFPLSACLCGVVYFLDFIRWGAFVSQDAANAHFYRGRIIGHVVYDKDFRETGKIPCLIYPIVAYKKKGKFYKCIGNKPSFKKKGTDVSIRVCSDGEARNAIDGLLVTAVGVTGITLSILAGFAILSMSRNILMMH